MKKTFFGSLLIVFILQSCCFGNKGSEIDRIQFSEMDKSTIPYTENQVVGMVHSQGYEFDVATTIHNGFETETESECQDYTMYEFYYVNFVSEIPRLNIKISLDRRYQTYSIITLEIDYVNFEYDDLLPLETLEINGVLYENLYKFTSNATDFQIESVLYSNEKGIVKINYTNGDYVQIKE